MDKQPTAPPRDEGRTPTPADVEAARRLALRWYMDAHRLDTAAVDALAARIGCAITAARAEGRDAGVKEAAGVCESEALALAARDKNAASVMHDAVRLIRALLSSGMKARKRSGT